MSTSHEGLAEALAGLADTRCEDFDPSELAQRLAAECVRLLPLDGGEVLLAEHPMVLRVGGGSDERIRWLGMVESHTGEGPCTDCFRSGEPVTATPESEKWARWPGFTEQARQAGFRTVHAIPMRLRAESIGALGLFRYGPTALSGSRLRIARALAEVVTIGIVRERAVRRNATLAGQLETALHSRVVIEQAKGVFAGRERLGMTEAFERLRRHARSRNARLDDVARGVVDGSGGPAGTGHDQR